MSLLLHRKCGSINHLSGAISVKVSCVFVANEKDWGGCGGGALRSALLESNRVANWI